MEALAHSARVAANEMPRVVEKEEVAIARNERSLEFSGGRERRIERAECGLCHIAQLLIDFRECLPRVAIATGDWRDRLSRDRPAFEEIRNPRIQRVGNAVRRIPGFVWSYGTAFQLYVVGKCK